MQRDRSHNVQHPRDEPARSPSSGHTNPARTLQLRLNPTSDCGAPGLVDLSRPGARRWLAAFRIGALFLVLMSLPTQWDTAHLWLALPLCLYCAIPLFPDHWLQWRQPFTHLSVAIDIFVAAILIHVAGGLRTPLLPLLYLPVLEAAAVLSLPWAMVSAVGSALLVGFLGTWPQLVRMTDSAVYGPIITFTVVALFLVATLNAGRLSMRRQVIAARSLEEDLSRLKGVVQDLDLKVQKDPVTGLMGRVPFRDEIKDKLILALRHQRLAAMLLLDLDGFNRINNDYGSEVGDLLLKTVGERLRESIRVGDSVARLGDDEFAIALFELNEMQNAMAVAAKLISEVGRPLMLGEKEISATACVGISLFPTDGRDPDTLIKYGQVALRLAKQQGPNSVQIHAPKLAGNQVERGALERDLYRALDQEEFVLHYQPQVDLESAKMVGVEALVRWMHPAHGLLSPGKFIALAEENGLILPLTEWILRKACRQNMLWQAAGLPPFRVSVNLSARQFQRKTVIPSVVDALKGEGLDPSYLEVEITESLAMHDRENTVMVLRRLKEMGVEIALDDFGTGFSSLSYLKHFPFDTIKIDQSFVRDVAEDSANEAIVATIISLSHNLGRKVIAEGVETETQLLRLRKHGCHQIQGYLICKPVPAEQITRLFQARRTNGVQKYSRYSEIEDGLPEIIAKYAYSLPPRPIV
ncbi:MAG TPA: EAL domain-containing protein [Armatimonadota bacterium]|nr:EAL domain-containing protein [Armatimonadota bacterium]